VVFYHSEEQRLQAARLIERLGKARVFDRPIVTTVEPAAKFWAAEDYHHNYFNNNPDNLYCEAIIAPKLRKFLESKAED